jgi:Domain of unknown function (DUF4263)
MSQIITTRSVARHVSETDEIVLSSTPRTRTPFRPRIHRGGIRGHIIRQKIGSDGTWKDVNEVNFNQLAADCGVSIELSTEALARLCERVAQLNLLHGRSLEPGERAYVVGPADETIVVNDRNKSAVIQALLEQGQSETFWQALSKSDPHLAGSLAAARIQFERQQGIAEFEMAMSSYASVEDYWQKFFESRPWILQSAFAAPVFMLNGETYLGGKHPMGRQGKGGVATDFLFADESTKSFAVVEIKTPDANLTGSVYRGEDGTGLDNEIHCIHPELTGAVVQIRNQITVAVEDFQAVLQRDYHGKINRVHPSGVLVAGSTSSLTRRERDSFNHFRHGLHNLIVITFDELLLRLKLLYLERRADDDVPWPDQPPDTEESEYELDALEGSPFFAP